VRRSVCSFISDGFIPVSRGRAVFSYHLDSLSLLQGSELRFIAIIVASSPTWRRGEIIESAKIEHSLLSYFSGPIPESLHNVIIVAFPRLMGSKIHLGYVCTMMAEK